MSNFLSEIASCLFTRKRITHAQYINQLFIAIITIHRLVCELDDSECTVAKSYNKAIKEKLPDLLDNKSLFTVPAIEHERKY